MNKRETITICEKRQTRLI